MKIINVILLFLLCNSCSQQDLQHLSQEIVDGKISAIDLGSKPGYHYSGEKPAVYIQNNKITRRIEIPFEYENKWKVGDSCLLIIEKYVVKQ